MKKKVTANQAKCNGCGDAMIFSPEAGGLFCPSCNSKKQIAAESGLVKHEYVNDENLSEEDNSSWAQEGKFMQCPNCGAQTLLQNYRLSEKCPYCETDLIASVNNLASLKPDSIIPFAFGKERAVQIFKEKIRKKWFVPKKFKQLLNPDEIHAHYFPAFLFDANCSSEYVGRLYNVRSYRDSEGNVREERQYFPISGRINTNHENIDIEASPNLTQLELTWIKPYDYRAAKHYTNDFVYGHSLECGNSSVKKLNVFAKEIIKSEINSSILRSYNYDGVDYLRIGTQYLNQKFCYCYLPLYRINFTYKDKKYTNVLNGQTGKLGGRYPKARWKIFLIVLLIAFPFLLGLILSLFYQVF